MTKPPMDVNVSFRVRRVRRDAAQAAADKLGVNVSDELREALERLVKKGSKS